MDSNHIERIKKSTQYSLLNQSTGKVLLPGMSRQTVYQALYHVTVVYLPFVAAAVIFAVAYYLKKQAAIVRPWKGFPLLGLEEEGLSPKEAWAKHGHGVMAKGLKEHQGAFQVMTGTGPKVRKTLGYLLFESKRCERGKTSRR
jgi:hypothetical protein